MELTTDVPLFSGSTFCASFNRISINSFSHILSSFPVIYIGKADPVPLNPSLPETEVFIFMLWMFSPTYKVAFETISRVEREVVLWEREKRLQGHLL